jgi:hypothetical protein
MEIEKEILEKIDKIIDKKIREHEVRVGWISGLIGVFFVFGIVHSILLVKNSLPN